MITRFAPSPTGPLHLGHAYSAILAHDMAVAAGGRFVLRIEDIDQSRARPEWETGIVADLAWLGLTWDRPVLRQSQNLAAYRGAVQRLWDQGLVYPCSCNRRDILAAASAPQEGVVVQFGPDGPVYPGTCRPAAPLSSAKPEGVALRLDMARALATLSEGPLGWTETGAGPKGQTGWIEVPKDDLRHGVGDVVLARKDIGTAYIVAVVVDDAAQGITCAPRGQDLFEATKIHVLLQRLLQLSSPVYHHHRLIRDEAGRRLAKRDDAKAIALFRAEGASPVDIRAMVGL